MMKCFNFSVQLSLTGLICSIFALTKAGFLPFNASEHYENGSLKIYENIPRIIPNLNVSKIASHIDLFLNLWNQYVVPGNSLSDEPWTLLVPTDGYNFEEHLKTENLESVLLPEEFQKNSLSRTDKEKLQDILLNHVILRNLIDVNKEAGQHKIYYSMSDTGITFTKRQGTTYANGIKITAPAMRTNNGLIYAINEPIPLPESVFLQLVPIQKSSKIVNSEIGNDTKFNDFSEVPKVLPATGKTFSEWSDFQDEIPSEKSIFSSTNDIKTQQGKETTKKSSKENIPRPTRFEKYKPNILQAYSNTSDSLVYTNETKSITHVMHATSENKPKVLASQPKAKVHVIQMQNLEELIDFNSKNTEKNQYKLPERTFPEKAEELAAEIDEEKYSYTEFNEMFHEFDNSSPSSKPDFVQSLTKILNENYSNGGQFIHHFKDANLENFLDNEKKYTVLVPVDAAFYSYYPIDWGFNPFNVKNFTKDALLNHIFEGDIDIFAFKDHVQMQTILDRTVQVSQSRDGVVLVNGHTVASESEILAPHARIYFINKILFVDLDRVFKLKEQYPYLETASIVPWPYSPFLKHLKDKLQFEQNKKIFSKILNISDVHHMIPTRDENSNLLTYSAFIPTDASILKQIGIGSVDTIDTETANNFVLEHIVHGYLFTKDFENGTNLLSIASSVVPIKIQNGDTYVSNSKILKPQKYVFNLGALFDVENPLIELKIKNTEPFLRQVSSTSQTSRLKTPFDDFHFFSVFEKKSEHGRAVTKLQPEPIYEVRTEVSYSRKINDGEMEHLSKKEMKQLQML